MNSGYAGWVVVAAFVLGGAIGGGVEYFVGYGHGSIDGENRGQAIGHHEIVCPPPPPLPPPCPSPSSFVSAVDSAFLSGSYRLEIAPHRPAPHNTTTLGLARAGLCLSSDGRVYGCWVARTP